MYLSYDDKESIKGDYFAVNPNRYLIFQLIDYSLSIEQFFHTGFANPEAS
jgi:hypothetical protein